MHKKVIQAAEYQTLKAPDSPVFNMMHADLMLISSVAKASITFTHIHQGKYS